MLILAQMDFLCAARAFGFRWKRCRVAGSVCVYVQASKRVAHVCAVAGCMVTVHVCVFCAFIWGGLVWSMATDGGCEVSWGRGGGWRGEAVGWGRMCPIFVYMCVCVGSGAVHHRPANGIWESWRVSSCFLSITTPHPHLSLQDSGHPRENSADSLRVSIQTSLWSTTLTMDRHTAASWSQVSRSNLKSRSLCSLFIRAKSIYEL